MPYEIAEQQGVTILSVVGKMDDGFVATSDELISQGRTRIVIDLARSKYLLGDHIEMLASTHNKCEEAGGQVFLAHVQKDLAYILQIMELDRFFNIATSTEEAVEKLKTPVATVPAVSETPSLQDFASLDSEQRQQEEEVKQFVRLVARDMTGLRVLAQFAGGHMDRVTPKQVAEKLRLPVKDVAEACIRFIGFRILQIVEESKLRFYPREKAHQDISAFMSLWRDPANYSKIILWVDTFEAQKS